MLSEYRQDPITKQWVILSPGRAKRPEAFVPKKTKKDKHKNCVFCEGNEKKTPKETYAIRKSDSKPDTPGWDIRVVPNKFPIFRKSASVKKIEENSFFDSLPAVGIHEVSITNHPHKDLGQLNLYKTQQVVETYLQRFNFHKHNPFIPIRYMLIIHNHGKSSGASIPHPHSQILGFNHWEGSLIERELVGSRDYFFRNKKCVFCDMQEKELRSRTRTIWGNNNFIAFCPYASRYPFETWIMPRFHNGFFEYLKIDQMESFAEILRVVLAKMYKGLNNPDYNFYIHTSPTKFVSSRERDEVSRYYHWHVEILPKITTWGGFEFGTNMIINVVSPEDAARFLKKIKVN